VIIQNKKPGCADCKKIIQGLAKTIEGCGSGTMYF